MDTIAVALISVVICVILFAFYFQYKFIGVDARTREAEKVALSFNKVLETTKVGDDIRKNYQAVQRQLTDVQDENAEAVDDLRYTVEALRKENAALRGQYNQLVNTLKSATVEGLTITDALLAKEPVVPVLDESDDEEFFRPARKSARRTSRSDREVLDTGRRRVSYRDAGEVLDTGRERDVRRGRSRDEGRGRSRDEGREGRGRRGDVESREGRREEVKKDRVRPGHRETRRKVEAARNAYSDYDSDEFI